jgi:hypothetical protein
MKSERVSVILIGGLVLVVSAAGLYSILCSREDVPRGSVSYENEYRSIPSVTQTEPSEESSGNKDDGTTDDQPEPFVDFSDEDIRKGDVKWQKPEDLGDLGWTDKDVYEGTYSDDTGVSNGIRYVKVGTVVQGKYSGAEVLVVLSWMFGDGPHLTSPNVLHYLRWQGKVARLPYATTRSKKGNTGVVKTWSSEYSNSKLAFHIPNEQAGIEARIEELATYPDEFVGMNDREVFIRNGYSGTAFFSRQGLKPAFTQSVFGTVWMTDSAFKKNQEFELNSYRGWKYVGSGEAAKRVMAKQYYSPIIAGGFFLVRPDGLVESYRLKFDIFDVFDRDGLLQAVWNDGTRNEDKFEEYPGGCGIGAYAYDMTSSVAMEDLIGIGKTDKGDVIYGYRSADLKAVVTMYDEARSGYISDKLASIETREQFLLLRPVIFWRDPVGRLLMFKNAKLMPLAECGKPVVYLYPEKTTEVSVKVFPGEGVRVSDPEYGDGWNVVAQPDGTLTNMTDGKWYGSLFWEGGSDVPYEMPKQGFVASADDLDGFFDQELAQLGLVGREIADFKEFWIPKMLESGKPYYFITFLPREQIDQMAPLAIYPKPDTIIRVMMDYEGLDTAKSVDGFRIRTPERRGFTAVEWGGRLK